MTAPRDHRRIAALAEEAGARCLVVGLPLSLDGSTGPAAVAALAEADELAAATGLPVEMWDERLTTVTADRDLIAMRPEGRRPPQGGRQGRSGRHAAGLARPRRLTAPEDPHT